MEKPLKSQEFHGKNHKIPLKTVGIPWENLGKTLKNHIKST